MVYPRNTRRAESLYESAPTKWDVDHCRTSTGSRSPFRSTDNILHRNIPPDRCRLAPGKGWGHDIREINFNSPYKGVRPDPTAIECNSACKWEVYPWDRRTGIAHSGEGRRILNRYVRVIRDENGVGLFLIIT